MGTALIRELKLVDLISLFDDYRTWTTKNQSLSIFFSYPNPRIKRFLKELTTIILGTIKWKIEDYICHDGEC